MWWSRVNNWGVTFSYLLSLCSSCKKDCVRLFVRLWCCWNGHLCVSLNTVMLCFVVEVCGRGRNESCRCQTRPCNTEHWQIRLFSASGWIRFSDLLIYLGERYSSLLPTLILINLIRLMIFCLGAMPTSKFISSISFLNHPWVSCWPETRN